MILFALPLLEQLAEALESLPQVKRGHFSIGRFANGELHVTVETPPSGGPCLVLGSVAPPDEELLSTLLLSHTLRKEGALRVIALLPYLGYARGDRAEPGKSLTTAWVGEILHASCVAEVATVDLHSLLAHQLFPIPLRSLSPAKIFAAAITPLRLADVTIVAPDEGALERCEAVRRAAGIQRPLAHFTKKRTQEGVTHSTLHGTVSSQVLLVDDILDTGKTLVSACEALGQMSVEEIIIMTTHALFTGTRWERLWTLGVSRLYCTDSVPLPQAWMSPRIAVLSVAPLIADYLSRLPVAETKLSGERDL